MTVQKVDRWVTTDGELWESEKEAAAHDAAWTLAQLLDNETSIRSEHTMSVAEWLLENYIMTPIQKKPKAPHIPSGPKSPFEDECDDIF